jgi:hypothetical protein
MTISAHVTTISPKVDHTLTVSGQVDGATTPVTVSATRKDSAADTTPVASAVPVQDDGSYTFTDQPPVRGSVTYTVTVDMDPSVSTTVTTTVRGLDPGLTVSTSRSRVPTGTSVHVSGHLAAQTTNRDVTLYARPYRRDQHRIASGNVDTGGAAANHVVVRRTRFIAVFAGDDRYRPTQASRVVGAHAILEEHLRREYGHAHGYALYRVEDNPALLTKLLPVTKGLCIRFRAQRRYAGTWHATTSPPVSNCASRYVHTDSYGTVLGILAGNDHVVGQRYRLRAEWHGNRWLLPHNGAWLELEFRN